MDELTIGDKTYISSKRAAEITGYAKDYIGQLCREGRVNARLVGRNWYVLEESLRSHRFGEEPEKGEEKEEHKVPEATPISPTWEVPRYQAEEPVRISELLDTEHGAAEETFHEEARPTAQQSVIADMQLAWKDWFLKREHEQEEVVEAPVTDANDSQGKNLEAHELESTEESEEAVPVHIERVSREEEQLEEIILSEKEEPEVIFHQSNVRNEIFKERKMSLQPKNRLERPAAVLSTVVALISLSIVLLGSGVFDSYFALSALNSEFIQYLAGVSVKQGI